MASVPDVGRTSAERPRVAAEWCGLFDTVEEVDGPVTAIEGRLPAGLVGTLYRNGPGLHDYAESFFDGDGMIRALTFREDGSVHHRSRFVRTPKYVKQTAAGRAVQRGVGTNLPGGALRNAFRPPAHEANTSVRWHAGQLLALAEGGCPYAIGPDDLSTLGPNGFGGALGRRDAFTAHPHVDPETGDAICFGMRFGWKPHLRTFRIDRRGRFHQIRTVPRLRDAFVHDFAITSSWLVFFFTPTTIDLRPLLLGQSTFFDSIRWRPELGTGVALVPRAGGEIVTLETDPFQVGHTVGAFEAGGEVVVDLCQVESWERIHEASRTYRTSDWGAYAEGSVRRHRIDVARRRIASETLCALPAEFPSVRAETETRRGRWAYFASNTGVGEGGWFRAVLKLDRESGEAELFDFGRYKAVLEPVFVPRPGGSQEDDGWLLVPVHDGARRGSDVAVLDARRPADGPIATLHLPGNAGITFHGTWRPEA